MFVARTEWNCFFIGRNNLFCNGIVFNNFVLLYVYNSILFIQIILCLLIKFDKVICKFRPYKYGGVVGEEDCSTGPRRVVVFTF